MDQIKCTICTTNYHKQCVTLPRDTDAASLAIWICPECQSSRRRGGDNSNTPVRNVGSTRSLLAEEDSAQCSKKMTSSPNIENSAEEDIIKRIGDKIDIKVVCKFDAMKKELMSDLREDIKLLVQEEVMKHLEKLKTEFNNTTEYLAANQDDLKKIIAGKEKEIESLSIKCAKMESDILLMSKKYEEINRQGRSRNLEIQMVPEKKNENVLLLFKNLCSTVGCAVSDTDINACRRVAKFDQKSHRPRNIVVTLSSTTHRDSILSAVYRYNKSHKGNVLSCSNIGIDGDTSIVYVVEHLSAVHFIVHVEAITNLQTPNHHLDWRATCGREVSNKKPILLETTWPKYLRQMILILALMKEIWKMSLVSLFKWNFPYRRQTQEKLLI